ncbi:MAG: DMT family transporter, partial [Aestuariivirga sp.]
NRRIALALILGLMGMAVIVTPRAGATHYSDQAVWGALAAFASAISFALAMVLLRARARHDAITTIVFIQNVGPAILLAIPAYYVWTPLTGEDWLRFAVIGALGTGGHLLLARAFALAEATALAPVEYTSLVWAVGLGYLFFGEVPTLNVLGGAALIIIGTMVTGKHEPTPDIDVELMEEDPPRDPPKA